MQRIYYHLDPADLKNEGPRFVPMPARLVLGKGGAVYFCLDSGGKKAPIKAAARAKIGQKRFRKPRVMQGLLVAEGKEWRLEFSKLPELERVPEKGAITIQPGILLEAVLEEWRPVGVIVYAPDDATAYGAAGGDHENIPCPELARDIEWHQDHLEQLGDLKRACEGLGGGAPIGGGGGIGVTLESDSSEDSSELCEFVDFMISTAEKDLADAQEEFRKRCNQPSV